MDATKLRKLAELYDQRKALEDAIKQVKEQEDQLNAELVEDFTQDGMSSTKVDGRTFYLHQQTWATTRGDPQAAVKALAALGMPECLMMGTMRVSGMIREQGEEQFFAQYPELREVIGTEVRTNVRVRKG